MTSGKPAGGFGSKRGMCVNERGETMQVSVEQNRIVIIDGKKEASGMMVGT